MKRDSQGRFCKEAVISKAEKGYLKSRGIHYQESKFSVGDQVECIEGDKFAGLTEGEIYTIEEVNPGGILILKGGVGLCWSPHRFKKAEVEIGDEVEWKYMGCKDIGIVTKLDGSMIEATWSIDNGCKRCEKINCRIIRKAKNIKKEESVETLSLKKLLEMNACNGGVTWFCNQYAKREVSVKEVLAELKKQGKTDYVKWVEEKFPKCKEDSCKMGDRFIVDHSHECILAHVGDNNLSLIEIDSGNTRNGFKKFDGSLNSIPMSFVKKLSDYEVVKKI